MPRNRLLRGVFLLICLVIVWGGATVSLAAGETFKVISVNTTGCNSGNFGMTVERTNLDGGAYTVHTVVTVDGLDLT
ncbi:MAG: hypothetical protein U0521_18165 [Anaerolineae bacterium]